MSSGGWVRLWSAPGEVGKGSLCSFYSFLPLPPRKEAHLSLFQGVWEVCWGWQVGTSHWGWSQEYSWMPGSSLPQPEYSPSLYKNQTCARSGCSQLKLVSLPLVVVEYTHWWNPAPMYTFLSKVSHIPFSCLISFINKYLHRQSSPLSVESAYWTLSSFPRSSPHHSSGSMWSEVLTSLKSWWPVSTLASYRHPTKPNM